MRLILGLLTTLIQKCFQDQKQCSQTPFHYEYTECDSKGNRLRIQVPNETCVGNVQQPSNAKSCFFSCRAGTYLDAQTEDCRPCPPGTYSLGGGYRYEDFSDIPSEFTVTKDEDFETLLGFNGESEAGDQTMYSCKKYDRLTQGP
uniref:Tyrosine-protein kinase ephrin type A/B receptor-like domain-containing protein n=1 Tax=Romanomermis culicivorax TaxID=13658 RepID=A0A915JKR0_ROMCU